MVDWTDLEAELEAVTQAEFAEDVVIHHSNGDLVCSGVFEYAVERRDLPSGGHVVGWKAELYISNLDAVGVEMRHTVTVRGKVWRVVLPPEAEGVETTKLLLGADDGQQSGSPDIRY